MYLRSIWRCSAAYVGDDLPPGAQGRARRARRARRPWRCSARRGAKARLTMAGMTPALELPADWLPLIFAGLMGLSILFYVVLDGFDLGVGMLLRLAGDERQGPHDRRHRPLLGRQRDLAGARRRAAAGGLPVRAWRDPERALPAGGADAGGADAARRRLRIPRQGGHRPQAAVGPGLRRRLGAGRLAQGYMLGHWITGFRDDGWATLVLAVDRRVPAGRLRASRRRLADHEDRGRAAAAAVRWARRACG